MMLGIIMNTANKDDSMTSKTLSGILTTLLFVLSVCAFVLSVRISQDMRTTGSRVALICLAILYPDLFILLYFINPNFIVGAMSLAGSP
jgi:low temperature requirement protein LtrA